MTSQDSIRDEWASIPNKLRRRWRKLTPDDVMFPAGNAEYLATLLQRHYGLDRREAFLQVYEVECEL